MPIIRATYGPLTKEQKKELIRRFTEISAEVTGAPEQAHMVIIEEFPHDAIGVGTKTLEEFMKEQKK